MASIRERMLAAQAPQEEYQGAGPAMPTIRERMEMARATKATERRAQNKILAEEEFRRLQAENVAGMSTGAKLGTGFISGLVNIGQGVGNMVGLVDDETIAERKRMEAAISDTTAGSIGQFGGEMAGLAPLGFIGKGFQYGHKLIKGAQALPTAAKVLAGTSAALEGAGAGAILANPNERGSGAALGAGAGFVLNKAMAGLSRFGKDGLAKVSKEAKDLLGLVEQQTGKKAFIPLTQAADIASGSVTSKTKTLMDVLGLAPSVRDNLNRQSKEFSSDMLETNLRQAFGGFAKKQGDIGAKVLRETGDMQMALEAAKNASKKKVFSKTQQVLDDAARKASEGRYTPKQLLRSAEKSVDGDIAYAPLRDTAIKMEKVIGSPVGTSSVGTRAELNMIENLVGTMINVIPGSGEILGSKALQNFLMGNTVAQNELKKALQTGSGKVVRETLSRFRATMSGQPVEDDETNDLMSPVDLVKNTSRDVGNYATQASNALRGN